MPVAISNTRDVALLALACIAGALLVPMLPFVGLPLCAAGLGGQIYRGYRVPAAITVALGVAVSPWLRPADAVVVGIALAGILVAATRLRRSDAYTTALWLAPLLGFGFAATEFATARLSGVGFSAYFESMAQDASEVFGTSGTLGGVPLSELTETMLRFAPAGYLFLGAAVTVPTLAVLVWTASRTGAVIRPTPKLARVDLSPHVLWPLVLGMACMAAGRLWGGQDGLATTVGLNLLLAARLALLLQGLTLVASLLSRAGIRGFGFAMGIVFALVIDSASWFVSFVGLSDFWINYRRLNRGATPDGPEGPTEGL